MLACHRRSYDKGAQIEDPAHVQALVEQKRAARQHRATDRLAQAAPASQTLLIRAAERGANLGAITAALMRLLDRYQRRRSAARHPRGAASAMCRTRTPCASPSNVGASSAATPPPVAIVLPAHVQARDAPVQPHALETYDQLKERPDD